MKRRSLLKGIASGLLVWPAGACAKENQSCLYEGTTPTMVTGPFPPLDFRATANGRPNPGPLLALGDSDMDLVLLEGATGTPVGQVVRIEVQVLTAGCKPVKGADVQLWQADNNGNYNHKNERQSVTIEALDPNFGYWGSGKTDKDGIIQLRTIVPGAYPASRRWWRPPHIHWSVAAQGLGQVTTQSYFDGDLLTDIDRIRRYNDADLILHYLGDFASGMDAPTLEITRRRAVEELKVQFQTGPDGVPFGKLVLRLG